MYERFRLQEDETERKFKIWTKAESNLFNKEGKQLEGNCIKGRKSRQEETL